MGMCKHNCSICGESWDCEFPYYSNHDFFEDLVQQGYYCNAYCPSCESEKRDELVSIFGSKYSSTYLRKSFIKKKT